MYTELYNLFAGMYGVKRLNSVNAWSTSLDEFIRLVITLDVSGLRR